MTGEFEDSPNMVPGDVEMAEKITKPVHGRPRSQKLKLIFAVVALAVAGGWSYANQDDLKGALGYQPVGDRADVECVGASQGCAIRCASQARMAAAEGDACPMALTASGEKRGTCCENGKRNAMMAALLAPADTQVADEASEAGAGEESVPQDSAENGGTDELSPAEEPAVNSAEESQEISSVK